MKKLLLTGAAFASLMVGAAHAADLPRRSAPVVQAPIAAVPLFTWTGFYVGVNAGYGFGTGDDNLRIGGARIRLNDDREGFVGGGQAGFNYQMGMFVLGLETDLQYADLGERGRFRAGGTVFRGRESDDYFGTVRGRAGFAFDRALVYATGGLAYGDVGPFGTDGIGWTVGGGVEYAFTNNVSAKVEGLLVNLERDGRFRGVRVRGEEEFGVVRVGLNYKF
ncbi:MAG TPA: outer membrane protein [Microvirga sp.]|jgi:outer membrane immunogenic protein|nr:outer membrane protein [Microvirga sp.]